LGERKRPKKKGVTLLGIGMTEPDALAWRGRGKGIESQNMFACLFTAGSGKTKAWPEEKKKDNAQMILCGGEKKGKKKRGKGNKEQRPDA